MSIFSKPDKPNMPPPIIQPNSQAVTGTKQRSPSVLGGIGTSSQPLTRKATTSKTSLLGGA